MKVLLTAAMVAFAAASTVTVPAQATSVVISSDNGMVRIRDHRHRDWRRDRGWHRGHWRRSHWRRHHHRQHCRTRVVRHWRHHHLVVRKITVCR